MEQLIWRVHIVTKRERFDLHKMGKKILYSSGMDKRTESGYGASERRQLLWRAKKKLPRCLLKK